MYQKKYVDLQERNFEKTEKYTVLTPAEVMDVLGIGKNTMYEILNSGQLAGFRVGRNWRISADALEAFMLATQKQ